MATAYNQATAPAAIIALAEHFLGLPYSMQSPPGSFSDGHLWNLGDPYPLVMDCSGEIVVLNVSVGINISRGSAQDQWLAAKAAGWALTNDEDLQPGDTGAFMGAENTPGYAGHTATVYTYDPKTRTGQIIGEYDTAKGSCILPFDRDQLDNGSNGLGVIGFYRQIWSLPPAPKPPAPQPPEVPMEFIAEGPASTASFLYDTQSKTRRGLSEKATVTALEAVGIKNVTGKLPKTFLALFADEPNFD